MELSLVSQLGLSAAPLNSTRVLLVSEHKRDHLAITHILGAIAAQRYELTWCADLSHALEAMLSQIIAEAANVATVPMRRTPKREPLTTGCAAGWSLALISSSSKTDRSNGES